MAHPLLTVDVGEPRLDWCDRCLRTHAFADVLDLAEDGVRILGTWGDCEESRR